MSADLRARIAQALCLAFEHAASSVSTGSETITYGNMADVAAAEVQAELDAKDARIADTKRLLDNRVQDCVDLTQRAERAEADLARSKDVAIREAEQVRSERNRYAERAEQAEAERDRLRAADGRVREILDYFDGQIIALESGNPAVGSAFRFTFTKIRAALDQAPAAERDGGGR